MLQHGNKACQVEHDAPVFDHALQRLSIQVVSDVKLLQYMHCECAEVHYVLMHVEGPDVVHVEDFFLAERGLLELPAVLTTYSKHTCCQGHVLSHHLCKLHTDEVVSTHHAVKQHTG